MGLTIHYSLQADTNDVDQARRLVEQLRQRALDLPFESTGEIVEFTADDFVDDRESPHRWLMIQARRFLLKGDDYCEVKPLHVIAFTVVPGEGCEHANFGLCSYPRMANAAENSKGPRRIRTGLTGWSWESFCKTQYASNPACDGIENFLRCHLSLIKLLDHSQEMGILKSVLDEGGFWEKRDLEALVKEIGQWNNMMAAFVGGFKDAIGGEFSAEITKFPNFERLEAKGREKGQNG